MDKRLRRWISDDYGLIVSDLTPVAEGADVAAEVWRACTATGDSYAVKWSGGGTVAGPMTTAYLAASGVHGVPGPVPTRDGELWSERDGRRLSMTPWVDGARAAETGLTSVQWTEYGALLANVHSVEPPQTLREVLPSLNPVNARMPALARSVEERLRTPADPLEAQLAEVWQEHRDTIQGLLDFTSEPPAGQPVICHADPHLGNVLVGDHLHLIDWDDAVLAPREQDLMFMLGGMGSLGPATQADLDAFFAGYGPAPLDHAALRYYRHARALEDVALWADQAITGPDREDALEILKGVLGPDGLAVLALAERGRERGL